MEDGKEKQVPVESHGNQSPWTMEPLLHDMEDLRESGFVQGYSRRARILNHRFAEPR